MKATAGTATPGESTWNAVLSSALYVQSNQVHALRHVAFTEQVLSDGVTEEAVNFLTSHVTHTRDQRVGTGDTGTGERTTVRHCWLFKAL